MRKHSGLSTVVGAVFLVAVVVTSLSYVTYSVNTLGNFSESLITEEKRQQAKQDESFEILSMDITPANKLDGVVKNTGQIPLEIKSLWIEENDAPESVRKFDVNATIAPGNQIDLIDSVDFDMDSTKGYTMKMISSRGDVQSFYVNSPSSQNLLLNIHTIPEFVPSEFTTTILFTVANNMSNNSILYDLTPSINATSIGSATVDLRSGPNPTSYPSLGPGEIATFEYIYQLTGDVDEGATFNATIANAVTGNFVTTTASIKEVPFASTANTSLESFGLSDTLSNNDFILYFHDETDLTPGGYQMDGSDPSGGGSTESPSESALTFWSSNVTSSTVVTSGIWNSSLAYYSNLVPNGITAPSFAFMFECNNCGGTGDTADSTGNISADDFDDNSDPAWTATGGPDNDGYFTYDGNDYHQSEWSVDSDYTTYSDLSSRTVSTTAVWVRIPSTADNYMPIVRWGDENESSEDEYEIALGDGTGGNHGKFVFRYATNGDADVISCVSAGSTVYDTNTWYHVVGIRPADDQCSLYINGALSTSTTTSTSTSSISVDDNEIFIGHDGDSDYLIGDVAMFMHWNTANLASNVYDLYNTNYGTNGTSAHFTLQRTTGAGVVQETIYEDNDFELNFNDPAINSDISNRYNFQTTNSTYEKYSFYNFTTGTLPNITFATGERLKFNISWDSNTQNLPINIRFDDEDSNFVLPDASSYLQTSTTTPNWPTYLTIDNDDEIIYYVFNDGPEGVWFTYSGTRLILTASDASGSYGALGFQVNGTGVQNIDQDTDSIYIPDQNYAAITFSQIANPPQVNPPTPDLVPAGDYTAAVFISGYNDTGEEFLLTVDLGTVSVTD
jgi:hypothetical protein